MTAQETEVREFAFEAYGVRTAIRATPNLLERAREVLPPNAQPCEASDVARTYSLQTDEVGTYTVNLEDAPLSQGADLDLALGVLDAQVRLTIALEAPDAVFIHAGVVAKGNLAIIFPGQSFSGKTTLVAAMVRHGLTYYSDEYAVLDGSGAVHPYARPLSIRGTDRRQTEVPVESLGGTVGKDPLKVGAVIVTSYRAGAEWQPKRLSRGEGAMALLANAVAARQRPAEVMGAITRAVDGALVIQGERGDVASAVPEMLAPLEGLEPR